jgi:hypothetical protein
MTTDVLSAPETGRPGPGLASRVFGVLLSPRETYAAVAARPRSLGVLLVVMTVIVCSVTLFLRTEVGQEAALDQALSTLDTFGIDLPDEAYAQIEARMSRAWITSGLGQVIFWLPALAILAGLQTGIFSTLLGGNATYRQVFAVVAHSAVVIALQQAFSMALSYASGRFASANLGVFLPILEEGSFLAVLLGAVDLFMLWWILSLSMGLGVLYKRRTGGVATTFTALYIGVVLLYAVVRSAF